MKPILSLGRNMKDDNITKLMTNKDTCYTPRTPDSSQAPVGLRPESMFGHISKTKQSQINNGFFFKIIITNY